MTSQNQQNKELQRRVEQRLQEIEAQINPTEAPVIQTVKHNSEQLSKPWKRRLILGAKLFGLGVATLIAVKVASALAGIIVIATLVWVSYKLFFTGEKKKRS
ncbi:hypothetical protein VB711_03905 [Cronbergia sp. UHCC 0137]|uniref:hypothetical protein n=1 Tax=Cronbergia sp. UHCC 0137 TaxID=3110239 RepID=UPI002B1FDE67|nr:hypothetical protein [Cronbergia sp. UHCC 0137]MEA5616989.1 hypothetical protein [Cronbergia sp. UHCC 0137]